MGGAFHGRRIGLAALATLLLAGPALADVRVRYVAPERFTDAENRWGSGQSLRVTLAEMTRILEELGQRYLGAGDTLDLSVLDIDLAGFERPTAIPPSGLRVVTDATPPRIRLAYTLKRGGRAVARGEDTVTDINFLLTANPRFSTGGLYYERAVLRDWFARRFPRTPERAQTIRRAR
ncbi:DUF3016 domain-containing protein [Methylobacterium sp. NEAU 140]|uniref:DUF3016 domain-containing protein n=1 Tax=Methylobacterium sp. NEAU 140 TaxID=3064945 RepID=UPI00273749AE|nr:DUF3016 domain-containing protein [Methylobacterium sp. NEAU 140]MDP4021187.1 DUF3016 domain-containing protein [Methylobacterium sp. NEAU 140]